MVTSELIIIIAIVAVTVIAAGAGITTVLLKKKHDRQIDYSARESLTAPPSRPQSEEDPATVMEDLAEKAVQGQLVLGGRETHQADGRGWDGQTEVTEQTLDLDHLVPDEETSQIDTDKDTDSDTRSESVETVEPVAGRMQRLRSRLAQSGAFGRALLSVFSRGDLSEEDWEEIEDTLLISDLGVEATDELMQELRTQAKVLGTSDSSAIKDVLYQKLLELLQPEMDRSLHLSKGDTPSTVLTVGVNGTGKTTTIGKIARLLVGDNYRVLLGAADTFRAAAADQLETWGKRVGVDVIRSDKDGADPASVAFEAVKVGRERNVDVVMVDTAGRLQNKQGLMDELGKIKRVMERHGDIAETLLVLDATTGQNGMQQAQVFSQVVDVTGIVLTKLDGSAKGGIVVRVQRELGVPVKLVGLGEGPDDLAPFQPDIFAKALIEDK